ncbi:hypothetical protein BLNAU_6430 [Blattamonas nauphoetae]|uniref:Uncharacterized protein n=1 Tax=Blattamonas nauphoetae TaxID=2049346 RepID=A0ABQ9Y4I3_9EUKA|nr:hypothetical protein BLNAU_6430 [Blattamonas nauphoetae]
MDSPIVPTSRISRFSFYDDDKASDDDSGQVIQLRDRTRNIDETAQQELLLLLPSLDKSDNSVKLKTLKAISKIANEHSKLFSDFALRHNQIPRFSSMFIEEEDESMLESLLYIVLAVTTGDADTVEPLVYSGTVPKLIAIYSSQNLPFARIAIECLKNICLENVELRLFLCKHNFIEAIFKVMDSISAIRQHHLHPVFNHLVFTLPDELESTTRLSFTCLVYLSGPPTVGNHKKDIIDLCLNFLLTDSLAVLESCCATLRVLLRNDNTFLPYIFGSTLRFSAENEEPPTAFADCLSIVLKELVYLLNVHRSQYALLGALSKWRQIAFPSRERANLLLSERKTALSIKTQFTRVCDTLAQCLSLLGRLISSGEAETDAFLLAGIHQSVCSMIDVSSDLINPHLALRHGTASDDSLSLFLTQRAERPNPDFSALNALLAEYAVPPRPAETASSAFDTLSKANAASVARLKTAWFFTSLKDPLKESLFVLSNFCAGTPRQAEIMVTTSFPEHEHPVDHFVEVLSALLSFLPHDCQVEILWIFQGVSCASFPAFTEAILKHSIIIAIVDTNFAVTDVMARLVCEICVNLIVLSDPTYQEEINNQMFEANVREFLEGISHIEDEHVAQRRKLLEERLARVIVRENMLEAPSSLSIP